MLSGPPGTTEYKGGNWEKHKSEHNETTEKQQGGGKRGNWLLETLKQGDEQFSIGESQHFFSSCYMSNINIEIKTY